MDADTGRSLGIDVPTGSAVGNSLTTWIEALHEGMVFGVFYRICVSISVALIAVLSIAGTLVWVNKTRMSLGKPS